MELYYRLQFLNIPLALEERLHSICFDFGALGISENIPLDPKTLDQPIFEKITDKAFDVFFESEPSPAFFETILKILAPHQIRGASEENKDWLAEWKKGYHAFKLVGEHWIVPSWETPPAGVTPIFIDPGMAFGTGTHQTTQLCAELLYQTLSTKMAESLIDVGTGTAILAMLARRLGVNHILGTEIDAESVVTANENLKINKIEDIEIRESDLDRVQGHYDIVVANIIDGVLLDLKSDLLRLLNPNGRMVLSGILEERDNQFIPSFLENTSLKIIQRIRRDEWVAYLLG